MHRSSSNDVPSFASEPRELATRWYRACRCLWLEEIRCLSLEELRSASEALSASLGEWPAAGRVLTSRKRWRRGARSSRASTSPKPLDAAGGGAAAAEGGAAAEVGFTESRANEGRLMAPPMTISGTGASSRFRLIRTVRIIGSTAAAALSGSSEGFGAELVAAIWRDLPLCVTHPDPRYNTLRSYSVLTNSRYYLCVYCSCVTHISGVAWLMALIT